MNELVKFFKNISKRGKIILYSIGAFLVILLIISITIPTVILSKESNQMKDITNQNNSNFLKIFDDKNTSKYIFNTFLLNKKQENINYIKNDFNNKDSKILEWLNINVNHIPIKNNNAESNDNKNRIFNDEYNNFKKNINKGTLTFNDNIIPLFSRAYEKNVELINTNNLSFLFSLDGTKINENEKFYKYFFISNIENIIINIETNFFKNYDPKYINVLANFGENSYFFNELTHLTTEETFMYKFNSGNININSLFDNSLVSGFSGFIKSIYDDFGKNKTKFNKLLNLNSFQNKNNIISPWNNYSIDSKNESINLFKKSRNNLIGESQYKLNEFVYFLKNNIDLNNIFDKNGNNINLQLKKEVLYNNLSTSINTYFENQQNNFNELKLNESQINPNIFLSNVNIVNEQGISNSYNFEFYFGTDDAYSSIEKINFLSDIKENNENYYVNIKQKIFDNKMTNILENAKKRISLVITKGSEKYIAILGQFKDNDNSQLSKEIIIESNMIDSMKYSKFIKYT